MWGVSFEWRVETTGYQWRETATAKAPFPTPEGFGAPEWVLTTGKALAASKAKRYRPFEDGTLYLTFADTPPTMEGIVSFANTYGPLDDQSSDVRYFLLPQPKRSTRRPWGCGTLLSLWRDQITRMQRAVRLWQLVQDTNEHGLSAYIKWKDAHTIVYTHESAAALITSENHHPELLHKFRRGDVIMPALAYIQGIINENLVGRVSPRVLWDGGQPCLRLYITPYSLLGALWLQFAEAISEKKQYRICQQCGERFELSPHVARKDKRFHTNACRQQAFRDRKKQASASPA